MKVLTPADPESNYNGYGIFLGGSIAMGNAVEWQQEVIQGLVDMPNVEEIEIYNPRRPDWDNSQEQSAKNPYFKAQVKWELDHIQKAELVVFYFDPATPSPITLAEFGMVYGTKNYHDVIVCCPPGYWRKGNVDVMAELAEFKVVPDLRSLILAVREAVANNY